MGKDSKIEWTDHTFNPWVGCTKVSPGCQHCYAETLMDKRLGKVQWGPQGERVRTSASNWRQPLKWNREAEVEGVRRRVFCASLADVFEDNGDLIDWRLDLFENVIAQTPNLDWLILTKRPGVARMFFLMRPDLVFPNVWIGTSVEDQKTADERILQLLSIPAAVRFLSVEPLLGPVVFDEIVLARCFQWVIVGGESGPKARPMHPDWVRSIRDQCVAAGVPFFFKQWGEWALKGSTVAPAQDFGVLSPDGEWYPRTTGWNGRPIDMDTGEAYMRKVGKHAAGRLLDGRVWDQFPQEVGDDT